LRFPSFLPRIERADFHRYFHHGRTTFDDLPPGCPDPRPSGEVPPRAGSVRGAGEVWWKCATGGGGLFLFIGSGPSAFREEDTEDVPKVREETEQGRENQ